MKELVARSCPTLCDPWTVAPGTEHGSLALQVDSLLSEPPDGYEIVFIYLCI